MRGLKKYKINEEAFYLALAERRMSRAELAEAIGVSRQSLYHQLNGTNLQYNLIMAVSSELGMAPEELITEA